MVVCEQSIFVLIVLYVVLNKVMMFLAMRYVNNNIIQFLVAIAIFDMIFMLDVILLLGLLSPMCVP